MLLIEQLCEKIRHAPGLRRLSPVWNLVRPCYNRTIAILSGKNGLVRRMNGTDPIRLLLKYRNFPEVYEPEFWKLVMEAARPGCCAIDVGANVGLYALAIANRAGPEGVVIAVEPDPGNVADLRAHLILNQIDDHRIRIVEAALSTEPGTATLHLQGFESRVKADGNASSSNSVEISVMTLDEVARNRKVDFLLIDVEGFEEHVLRGGQALLCDPARRPAAIFIEVHPFAWDESGSSSDSLLALLAESRYRVTTLAGEAIEKIDSYGHVVARPLDRT